MPELLTNFQSPFPQLLQPRCQPSKIVMILKTAAVHASVANAMTVRNRFDDVLLTYCLIECR